MKNSLVYASDISCYIQERIRHTRMPRAKKFHMHIRNDRAISQSSPKRPSVGRTKGLSLHTHMLFSSSPHLLPSHNLRSSSNHSSNSDPGPNSGPSPPPAHYGIHVQSGFSSRQELSFTWPTQLLGGLNVTWTTFDAWPWPFDFQAAAAHRALYLFSEV